MFQRGEEGQEQKPFEIVYNFRSTSTHSSKVSKKRKIRKMSGQGVGVPLKKHRKMTANIEVERILEEQDMQGEARCAYSEAYHEPSQHMDNENCQIWGSSDLEKVIPFYLREEDLDEESQLEITSFRHLCADTQPIEKKNNEV